jgi:hypothetical protein
VSQVTEKTMNNSFSSSFGRYKTTIFPQFSEPPWHANVVELTAAIHHPGVARGTAPATIQQLGVARRDGQRI